MRARCATCSEPYGYVLGGEKIQRVAQGPGSYESVISPGEALDLGHIRTAAHTEPKFGGALHLRLQTADSANNFDGISSDGSSL